MAVTVGALRTNPTQVDELAVLVGPARGAPEQEAEPKARGAKPKAAPDADVTDAGAPDAGTTPTAPTAPGAAAPLVRGGAATGRAAGR